jgi:hypothetical protein
VKTVDPSLRIFLARRRAWLEGSCSESSIDVKSI